MSVSHFAKYGFFLIIGLFLAAVVAVVLVPPRLWTRDNRGGATSEQKDKKGQPNQKCDITSCHGFDIECGPDSPQMCTMEYRLGDFCRQFAQCQVLQGECQFVENSTFMNCRSCVTQCDADHPEDPMAAFECENDCREQFESAGGQ